MNETRPRTAGVHSARFALRRVFVRAIAGANQRAGLYMAEAHCHRFLLHEGKFFRRVVARDGQMVARRAQVLAHGEDVRAARGQVAEDVEQLADSLTESGDHSGLRHHAGRELLHVLQQLERPRVARRLTAPRGRGIQRMYPM